MSSGRSANSTRIMGHSNTEPTQLAISKTLGRVVDTAEWKLLNLPLFHVSRQPLSLGGFLDSAEFQYRPHYIFFLKSVPDEYASNQDFLARRDVETSFEAHRHHHHHSLPSRKSSIFCCISETDARQWTQRQSRSGGRIYELQVQPGSRVLLVDLLWFNYAVRVAKGTLRDSEYVYGSPSPDIEVTAAATGYWSGKVFSAHGGAPSFEALVDGRVKILRQL